MYNIKLKDICNLISRGYNCPTDNIENNIEKGKKVSFIRYSDISDSEISINKQLYLKNADIVGKYNISVYDLILPPTINTNLKVKCIQNIAPAILNSNIHGNVLYSSNAVIVRLSKPLGNYPFYMPNWLTALLNTDEMQNRLIEEVYSKSKLKSIIIDKLREFTIPYPTEELQKALEEYCNKEKSIIEAKRELDNKRNQLNNLITDILSK